MFILQRRKFSNQLMVSINITRGVLKMQILTFHLRYECRRNGRGTTRNLCRRCGKVLQFLFNELITHIIISVN